MSRLDQAENFLARKLSHQGLFTYQQLMAEGHFQFWELMEAWYRMWVKGTRPVEGRVDWFCPTGVPEGEELKLRGRKEFSRVEPRPYLPTWMRYQRE